MSRIASNSWTYRRQGSPESKALLRIEPPMLEPRPQDSRQKNEDWIEAAQLLRPQGRRGELLSDAAIALDLFTPGRNFVLGASATAPVQPLRTMTLEAAWQPTGRNAGRLVLQLGGIGSISEAEAFLGKFLLLSATDLPALEKDTYRVRDLIGCTLLDSDQPVGTVTDLQFPISSDGRRLVDAPDLLVVQPLAQADTGAHPAQQLAKQAPEPVLVPFVLAWLLEVDLSGRRLRMQLPLGLFENAEE